MGNVRHSTRRTVTCAFARKDTQGNIVKRVRHNLVYIYNTASNLTDGVILFHYRRMTQSFAVYHFLVLIEYFRILPLIHSKLISFNIQIWTSAVLPSGLVTLMQTARTPMAPTSVPVKMDFMEMEKHVYIAVNPVCYLLVTLLRVSLLVRL